MSFVLLFAANIEALSRGPLQAVGTKAAPACPGQSQRPDAPATVPVASPATSSPVTPGGRGSYPQLCAKAVGRGTRWCPPRPCPSKGAQGAGCPRSRGREDLGEQGVNLRTQQPVPRALLCHQAFPDAVASSWNIPPSHSCPEAPFLHPSAVTQVLPRHLLQEAIPASQVQVCLLGSRTWQRPACSPSAPLVADASAPRSPGAVRHPHLARLLGWTDGCSQGGLCLVLSEVGLSPEDAGAGKDPESLLGLCGAPRFGEVHKPREADPAPASASPSEED